MAQSIIVHGPMACGKTRNGKAIARKYGLINIVEMDAIGNNIVLEQHNTLYLTNQETDALSFAAQFVALVPYKVAIEGIKQ